MIYNVGGGGATSAENISYDNTESQLQAENVQDGIDELNGNLTAENSQRFKFGYQDGKYGYWKKEADTDVFVPFSRTPYLIFAKQVSRQLNFSMDIDWNKYSTVVVLIQYATDYRSAMTKIKSDGTISKVYDDWGNAYQSAWFYVSKTNNGLSVSSTNGFDNSITASVLCLAEDGNTQINYADQQGNRFDISI